MARASSFTAPSARARALEAPRSRRRRRPRARARARGFADDDVDVGTALTSPSGEKFQLLERLGSGSSAVTYRARCESNGADVALKTLTLRGRGRSTNGGFKAVELFERECATLRALDFERVPEYVDSFTLDSEFDRRYVLVQRLAVGRNLEDKVGEGWRPTEREAREILRQLLETLEYTSSLRPPVVHRDVKPANVVIDDDGERVFLVDFGGAAAAAIDSDSFGSTVVGTFGYMAPETLMGGSSPKSDQYGVGATVLFLLSGRPPSGFKTERLKVNFDEVYIEDRRLRSVLERLLEPSPEDRFRTPREALDALNSAATPMVSGRNFRGRSDDVVERTPTVPIYAPEPLAPRGSPKPKTMVTELVRDAGNSVSIAIPPSGANGDVLYKAFFGITWTAITGLWTAGVLASGAWLMALFSLPFWKVGADLSGEVVRSFVAKGDVFIDRENYRVACEGGGMKFIDKVGETADLEGCFVRPDGLIYLKREDDTMVPILASLSRREAEYIASEINAHLDDCKR